MLQPGPEQLPGPGPGPGQEQEQEQLPEPELEQLSEPQRRAWEQAQPFWVKQQVLPDRRAGVCPESV